MQRRLQNKIAESRWTLPVASVYGLLVWLLVGLLKGQLWVSFVCFVVSTYLMVELNNRNALLRIYSRMVSVSFITLSLSMPFVMSSASEAVASLCFLMAIFVLLFSYQDRQSMGKTFYTFAILSCGSLLDVRLLYYVPILWVSMAFYLQTMSWRDFFASIIGVLAPYWFASLALFFVDDPMIVVDHFAQLVSIPMPPDYLSLTPSHIAVFVWLAVLVAIGSIHFVRNSYLDSIRIRMIFNSFILISVCALLFMVILPSSSALQLRVLVIVASPLLAHYLALTNTRITNISFVVIIAVTLAITIFNLWMYLSPSL